MAGCGNAQHDELLRHWQAIFGGMESAARWAIAALLGCLDYTWTMRSLVATSVLICSFSVAAIEPPTEEELAGAEEAPLEFGEIVVTGSQFTFDQEVAFRLVRFAMNTPRSDKREDRDKWVCWIDRGVGSRLRHLSCARNGDLWALRPDPDGSTLMPRGAAGYGTILRSTRPVNRAKFNKMLATMAGNDEFDREFVALARAGQKPPRDIPSADELDRFALAYRAVGDLADADDDTLEHAIRGKGLTLSRYNRIVDLLRTYQSMENEVAIRLNAMAGSDG